ncbi:fasciclin domain-containing protein [Lyngbya confervoides]|uniref:Fasciclin domain-containing protein n=1 Tax=Lyngbya confervoides BDU141951 TaxID=1574623 RepID=A0ABD4T2X9_9CYAN|nr:fasciclin domain-containing protein [Lyngbya confervoides]MCM1982949.1 fasciclin domain-containing protein [Lyngbya confervoides BDU141951]
MKLIPHVLQWSPVLILGLSVGLVSPAQADSMMKGSTPSSPTSAEAPGSEALPVPPVPALAEPEMPKASDLAPESDVVPAASEEGIDTAADPVTPVEDLTEADPPTAETPSAAEADAASKTLVELASSAEEFSTLVQAIEAAGLTETLSGEGAFTVFAPTNAAFEALPPGVLEALLQPDNKSLLVKVLTYHVLPQKLMAADLASGEVETVAGTPATVTVEPEAVKIDDATVEQADVEASNGVIHAIDKVLVPAGLQ